MNISRFQILARAQILYSKALYITGNVKRVTTGRCQGNYLEQIYEADNLSNSRTSGDRVWFGDASSDLTRLVYCVRKMQSNPY